MWIKLLQDTDDSLVLKVKTISEGEKTVCFFPSENVDTINVMEFDKLSGVYNSIFKEKAKTLDFWSAVTTHEVMHFFSEFIAPWYAPIDILSKYQYIEMTPIIPNIIEDIAINNTLWLWEFNPIRSAGYTIPGITGRLIKCHEEFPFRSQLPFPISAVVENLNMIHMGLLKRSLEQSKDDTPKNIHIHLRNKLQGNIFHSVEILLNTFINSRAVSLTKNNRTMYVNLNINGIALNTPVYETQYRGKRIPQYVPVNNELITKIYDFLDEHFAEAYDIKVDTLRREAYTCYKKKLSDQMRKTYNKNDQKYMALSWKIFEKNRKLIFNFDLIDDKFEKKVDCSIGDMDVRSGLGADSWEQFTRMKLSELLRLKKWV